MASFPHRVSLALTVALAGCSSSPYEPPANLSTRSLGAPHVERGRIVDAWGRELVLRGVNVKTEILFDVTFPDGRTPNEVVAPWDAWDAPEIAARGFDFVRLCINWSGLEPNEGEFDDAFLARLDRVVDDLANEGVYVLVDFHQDAYSKELGEDGAPAWAILPAPAPMLSGPIAGGPGLPGPYASLDDRRIAQVTFDAFTSFFENREGLRDRFLPAWRLVAARYAGRPNVIGFEDMNEPVVSHLDDGPSLLYAFHDASTRELRRVNRHAPVWVEPDVFQQNFLFMAEPRTTPPIDGNVVWAPHLYPPLPSSVDTFDEFYASLEPDFEGMVTAAATWNAATVVGEFWARLGDPVANEYVDAVHALADAYHVGISLWNWRGYRNPGAYEGDADGGVGLFYDWDYVAGRWYLNRPGFEAYARPYAIAVPGRIESQSFDRATNAFEVVFEARGHEAAPLLYIPDHRFPTGFVVELDGAEVAVDRDASSSRALVPWSGARGRHVLRVHSAP